MARRVRELPEEHVRLDSLTPHPRNYRDHPSDQLDHIEHSIREHGLFRNVVISKDDFILAGHGVCEVFRDRLGQQEITVRRVPYKHDDPRALQILALDNELGRFAHDDDRMLTELLRELRDVPDVGLYGTGYDDAMLANLVFITRPADEVERLSDAEQWVGMPGFEGPRDDELGLRLHIRFATEEDRAEFFEKFSDLNAAVIKRQSLVWMAFWPPRSRDDLSSARFVTEDGESA